jgi:hypothetical protein
MAWYLVKPRDVIFTITHSKSMTRLHVKQINIMHRENRFHMCLPSFVVFKCQGFRSTLRFQVRLPTNSDP